MPWPHCALCHSERTSLPDLSCSVSLVSLCLQAHVRAHYLLPRKHVRAYRAAADAQVTAEAQVAMNAFPVGVIEGGTVLFL
jgi:hypothetical protein